MYLSHHDDICASPSQDLKGLLSEDCPRCAPTDKPAHDEPVIAAPHQLKSAGLDQVMRALRAGGSVAVLASSFYSGGYSYTHILTTKRGKQYRVSKQVMRSVPVTTSPALTQS
ncbi:hypothetical protein LJR129_004923 [Acidovorax sp. LjRoot129]|uniref:hypothetical protein n=1 Tax=Acidovorax sp. LjRoot129 TaxID=3342260 RepID=UPI003ECE8730